LPLLKREGPDGPYWVRPPFRPDDYRVDPNSLRAIEAWRGDLNVDELLAERDGPFQSWDEVKRFDRGGRKWVRFIHSSADYCVDVEVAARGLGEVATVDPLVSYNLALERDRTRKIRIVHE
jgi:hypothetical protein